MVGRKAMGRSAVGQEATVGRETTERGTTEKDEARDATENGMNRDTAEDDTVCDTTECDMTRDAAEKSEARNTSEARTSSQRCASKAVPEDIRRDFFETVVRFRRDRYDMRPLFARGTGMTPAEVHALVHLLRAERAGRCTRPSDIARHARITPGAISQILKGLERKGMVDRERSTEDSRVVALLLTDRGRAAALDAIDKRGAFVNGLVSAVGEDEMREFLATLKRIMAFCDDYLGTSSQGDERPEEHRFGKRQHACRSRAAAAHREGDGASGEGDRPCA